MSKSAIHAENTVLLGDCQGYMLFWSKPQILPLLTIITLIITLLKV